MTLAQLAALLDSLKRPIEEAPRNGNSVLGINPAGVVRSSKWCNHRNEWLQVGFGPQPTHFLPLPVAGPVEFEVVPVGTVRKVHIKGLISRDGRIETEEDPRPCVRGLETGAEVGRLEGEEE